MPGLAERILFSPARAWHPAVLARSARTLPMSTTNRYIKHLAYWLLAFVGAPALIFVSVTLVPGGQLLAVLIALYFYVGPAALVGQPYFAGEFGFPDTAIAYWIIGAFWVVIIASFTVISVWLTGRPSRDRLRRPRI
jgi:hypothetical protein